jgi:uncharacterized RDD family membrane protein YckC
MRVPILFLSGSSEGTKGTWLKVAFNAALTRFWLLMWWASRAMDGPNCLCNDLNHMHCRLMPGSLLDTIGRTSAFWYGGAMSDSSWYYMQDNIPSGPVSWTRLQELAQSGMIGSRDLVRHEESPDWVFFANAELVEQTIGHSLSPPVEHVATGPVVPAGWTAMEISPWRRYGARMLDTATSGLIGVMAIAFAWFALAPISAERFFSLLSGPVGQLTDAIITTIIAGLVNGIVIGATGSSIGKAIFGIKVLTPQHEAIGIIAGWVREAKVWVIGLSLGIPLISLFTLLISYRRLKEKGETPWDHGLHVVLYRPASDKQTLLNILGVAVIFAAAAFFRWVGQE